MQIERVDTRSLAQLAIAPGLDAIVRGPWLGDTLAGIADRGIVVAALADGELRGYATLVHEHDNVFELGSIDVARTARRHGVGSALLAALAPAIANAFSAARSPRRSPARADRSPRTARPRR